MDFSRTIKIMREVKVITSMRIMTYSTIEVHMFYARAYKTNERMYDIKINF